MSELYRCIECTLLRVRAYPARCIDCTQNIMDALRAQELRKQREHEDHVWQATTSAVLAGCPVTFDPD